MSLVITGAVALLFAAIHVLGRRLRFLWSVPRSIWLSAAGGVSVAYVFVHLLPELAAHQATFSERTSGPLAAFEHHVYVLALAGLSLFYGLERFARRAQHSATAGSKSTPVAVFWIHLGAFAVYNLLIGYLLLHREEQDVRGLIFYAVAMGLHFIVNDQGLRALHGALYDRLGRWPLAIAPLLGWAIGIGLAISPIALSALFAVLAGGVVLNVLKEELPEDRESRFWAFGLGVVAYAALLLLTG